MASTTSGRTQPQEQQHTQADIQQRHLQPQIQHHLTSTSRGESQHHKDRIINFRTIIREEKISLMTLDDREVIIQILEIIMQEHPGNSCQLMSDDNKLINIMNQSIASEFVMDMIIDIMIDIMQDSFTKELNIKLKNILEKITPADFDITLAHQELPENSTHHSKTSSEQLLHHQGEVLHQKLAPWSAHQLQEEYHEV